MSDQDPSIGVSVETTVIPGAPVANRQVHELSDIIQRGEVLELRAKRKLMRRAGQEGADIVPDTIEVRWILEVDATAWPRPAFVVKAHAAVQRELDARRQAARELYDDLAARGEADRYFVPHPDTLDPDPVLVAVAEQAETTWQSAIAAAAEERGYKVVHFDPRRR